MFQEMAVSKLEELKLNDSSQLKTQRKNIKNALFNSKQVKINLEGRLSNTGNDKETEPFCEKLNTELKGIMQLIEQKVSNQQENIQQLKEIIQVYNRREDLYQVLTYTKNFERSDLNQLLQMLRNKKITNCLEFFKDKTQLKFIASVMQNVNEIDFNKKNYSLRIMIISFIFDLIMKNGFHFSGKQSYYYSLFSINQEYFINVFFTNQIQIMLEQILINFNESSMGIKSNKIIEKQFRKRIAQKACI
ncbi:unnamed protein product [Paramecium octaurelia]|uniref:Uncharacterized protein n=1 Tax=Paramecium octaurelia TaxID=43137 RepID=A0A8S1YKU2_PAROT|nr:unnamed protein product [Paramecium octaurelia]